MKKLILFLFFFKLTFIIIAQGDPEVREKIEWLKKDYKTDMVTCFDWETYSIQNNKTKKWGLYYMGKLVLSMKYDSLKHYSFGLALYSKGKLGVYFFEQKKQTIGCEFDNFVFRKYTENCSEDIVESDVDQPLYCNGAIALMKNGKAAWINSKTGNALNEFIYSGNDLPEISIILNWQKKINKEKAKRNLNLIKIIRGAAGEDGVYLGRNKVNNKWGVFQGNDELIPALYDSIGPLGYNPSFITVYLNGKAGIYMWRKKETVACMYDKIKYITFTGFISCGNTDEYYECFMTGAQKGNKWAWINPRNGVPRTEFIYDSYEELIKSRPNDYDPCNCYVSYLED